MFDKILYAIYEFYFNYFEILRFCAFFIHPCLGLSSFAPAKFEKESNELGKNQSRSKYELVSVVQKGANQQQQFV